MNDNKYWATLGTEELGPILVEKITDARSFLGISNHSSRMREAAETYYGVAGDVPSHRIVDSGEVGELSLINVNYGRYLVQHMLSLVAGAKVSYNAIPNNTDVKSRQQAILANSLLNAYAGILRLERIFYNAAESAIVTSEGFVCVTWDSRATDAEGKADSGDVLVEQFTPFDIIRDLTCGTKDPQWYIVRRFENKYDLIDRYSEAEEDILNATTQESVFGAKEYRNPFYALNAESDYVPIYSFYHSRTPALPMGREVLFLGSNKILKSGPLPYKKLPLYRMSPADIMGMPLGYTPYFDALSAIEAYNALHSTILSNQFALGTQKVWSQKGDDIDIRQLAAGLVNIQTSGPKPEALNLVQSATELFTSKEDHRGVATLLMGLNDTSLGIQQQRLSGSAMSILDQKTTQFASPLHESYNHLVESVGQAILETLQMFAVEPRVAQMVGKNNVYMLKSFSAEDLTDINRVTVEVGDPSMRSFSVRQQMADKLMGEGLFKSKEEYYSALTTGQIEIETEGPVAERNLIQEENEMLGLGQEPTVIDTDEHILHILKHKCILANPDARLDPAIVVPTLSHINKHIEALRMVDPELLMILGQQPSQMNQQLRAQSAGAPDVAQPAQEAAAAQPTSGQDAVDGGLPPEPMG